MKRSDFRPDYAASNEKRYGDTLRFMEGLVQEGEKVLDIGPSNPFSEIMIKQGYDVENTPENLDLDLNFDIVKRDDIQVVTAFEILEHLVSPFPLLYNIKAKKLIASIPLRLWFATAYWNEKILMIDIIMSLNLDNLICY